jgi:penicillin-binding protein 1A
MKIRYYIIILTSLLIITSVSLSFYIKYAIDEGIKSKTIPSVEELDNPTQSIASRVYSSDGVLLDYFFTERRVNLKIDEIPRPFINALLATEDRAFYKHWGLHIERIFKAAIKTLTGKKQGASTITQQLARTLYLDQAPTLNRKVREAYTAIKIEERYTKNEILEMYINSVYYGNGAYGLFVASQRYFGKKPIDLTQPEIAYLVGVINAPTAFNAYLNYDRGLRRRNVVLYMMREGGAISEDEYWAYVKEPILLRENEEGNLASGIAPHYVEMIRQDLKNNPFLSNYNLYNDGLTIYTGLNATIQEITNKAVDNHLKSYQELFDKKWNWAKNKELENTIVKESILKNDKYRAATPERKEFIFNELIKDNNFRDSVKNVATTIQCGVIVLEQNTGKILAIVGASPKFMRENLHAKHSLNHVTQIRRQPGSSIKPFVYAAAIKNGMRPDDTISCGPFVYIDPVTNDEWRPKTGTDDCPDADSYMTLREGLRRSINSVAARLITQKTTPFEVREILQRAGVNSKIEPYPALSLGAGGEIKPMELASSYSIFANNGYHIEPYYLTKIEDEYGNTIFEKKKSNRITDALDKTTANITAIMMEDVVNRGTAARLRNLIPRDISVAGKTGTTNENADAWFTGFTPEIIACVWVGFDDQRINFDAIGNDGQGGRAAAPIFGNIIKSIYENDSLGYKVKDFPFRKEITDTLKSGGATFVRRKN